MELINKQRDMILVIPKEDEYLAKIITSFSDKEILVTENNSTTHYNIGRFKSMHENVKIISDMGRD